MTPDGLPGSVGACGIEPRDAGIERLLANARAAKPERHRPRSYLQFAENVRYRRPMRRLAVVVAVAVAGCTSTQPRPPPRPPLPPVAGQAPPSVPAPTSPGTCLFIHAESATPAIVEGKLVFVRNAMTPFTLHLTRPRCVVGLARALFVMDVQIASSGPDLRPLVGSTLRIEGDALAGENALGGPAVVVLARDFIRVAPTDDDDPL